MSTDHSVAPQDSRPALGFAAVLAALQRTGTNLVCWIGTLGRSPRARPPRWPAAGMVAIAVTVAVIVGSMFLLDAAAIAWAKRLPHWLYDEADQITNFGQSGYFLYPLGLIFIGLAAAAALSPAGISRGAVAVLAGRFGFLFVAIGIPSLFTTTVKRMIGRARPYVGSHDDPFAYAPFIWRADYASMPSGHATTAAAAAIAIGAIWPRLRAPMWLYALVIMTTRVIIAVHHPSDVLAGALVGVVGALLVRRWFAARRLVFFAHDLRPLPGPSWRRLKTVVRQIVRATPSSAG